ncbi:trypsin-like serine protease with C-terminal PDZ domain [Aequorivita sublithincola DSM 14238]|uniref:Trypsin-like serine protease with C-terminal PDZ domain n=1 Tax=Aequorivita sublithincola (strain DSM 14238 / LMG 21431 / ACAM 643 / 9-3) TaxID=746697 RepID=I3YXW1_AEQSU|nr:trypsin-like peptidase domain-containing protein [Aequorivita sublithincola]AFL81829.1 trypsin-like serine protease with C-terminal PDZ domain [Aequorivita sublithincola DSM 14238]
MKQTVRLFLVALFAGAVTLGGYKYLEKKEFTSFAPQQNSNFIPTSFSSTGAEMNTDFTQAAEKTVHAVVHVKNTTVSRKPSNIMEYFQGGGQPREMVGSGSGVIISPDGYIVTNNHVIANASNLEVTLNNNKTYTAKLIGTDPATDIALIKIDGDDDFAFIPFGDSNNVKIGEWVLAVGNPFNLTSTVTAGIISAKARDLNQFDGNPQSFIQTDAAVNRGNSGGALVNTRGELIGINTAITSETGSYVGYSFAVPSNNARKVIEDIMEYGNVQRGILGIQVGNINQQVVEKYGINDTEGVFVGGIEKGSGADKAGIKEGDIIKQLDGYKVSKFADLSGYLGSKRPKDVVEVTVLREGSEKKIPVTLEKLETFSIDDLGLEVKNTSSEELKQRGLKNGVTVTRALTPDMAQYKLEGIIITKINDESVKDTEDVKRIMSQRDYRTPIKMTFMDGAGNINSFIFR